MSTPGAITATVAPPAASAPSCAAVSMPRARPGDDHEARPRPARAASRRAKHAAVGAGVARADDRDRGPSSSSGSPRTASTGGASASGRRQLGVSRVRPWSTGNRRGSPVPRARPAASARDGTRLAPPPGVGCRVAAASAAVTLPWRSSSAVKVTGPTPSHRASWSHSSKVSAWPRRMHNWRMIDVRSQPLGELADLLLPGLIPVEGSQSRPSTILTIWLERPSCPELPCGDIRVLKYQ